MKRNLYTLLILLGSMPLFAQKDHANCPMKDKKAEASYTDRVSLEIKSLRPDDIDQYRKGTGMGLAIPAELNGYPGPRHVLDLAVEVALTDEQKTKMKSVYSQMHTKAVRLGEEIIALETTLDAAFAGGTMNDATLAKLTSEIAVRQAGCDTHTSKRISRRRQ
ncbi:MAG: hypothetical protein JJE51_14670 [Thermoanaerobaculia bacterium]|nr:hypothetical protein [Thermoanaerobaculia bacterium]